MKIEGLASRRSRSDVRLAHSCETLSAVTKDKYFILLKSSHLRLKIIKFLSRTAINYFCDLLLCRSRDCCARLRKLSLIKKKTLKFSRRDNESVQMLSTFYSNHTRRPMTFLIAQTLDFIASDFSGRELKPSSLCLRVTPHHPQLLST